MIKETTNMENNYDDLSESIEKTDLAKLDNKLILLFVFTCIFFAVLFFITLKIIL